MKEFADSLREAMGRDQARVEIENHEEIVYGAAYGGARELSRLDVEEAYQKIKAVRLRCEAADWETAQAIMQAERAVLDLFYRLSH